MPHHYADMCGDVHAMMMEEVELDGDNLYLSSYFTDVGRAHWKGLLLAACRAGDDVSLAQELGSGPHLKAFYFRQTKNGPVKASVPCNAHEVIAESNFSRFYLRALCRFALLKGVEELVGYRAMEVAVPRPGSEEKIGTLFAAAPMLDDLRATMDRNPMLGMPPGVGSGILARLP